MGKEAEQGPGRPPPSPLEGVLGEAAEGYSQAQLEADQ